MKDITQCLNLFYNKVLLKIPSPELALLNLTLFLSVFPACQDVLFTIVALGVPAFRCLPHICFDEEAEEEQQEQKKEGAIMNGQSDRQEKMQSEEEKQVWMKYWVCFAFYRVVEQILYPVYLSNVPMYFQIKLAFFVALYHPDTNICPEIYTRCILPLIKRMGTDFQFKQKAQKKPSQKIESPEKTEQIKEDPIDKSQGEPIIYTPVEPVEQNTVTPVRVKKELKIISTDEAPVENNEADGIDLKEKIGMDLKEKIK